MSTLMRGVSDKEINALAAYYAAQKLTTATAPRDDALASRGQELAKKLLCGSCHMPTIAAASRCHALPDNARITSTRRCARTATAAVPAPIS